MATLTTTVRGPRDADEVWERYARPQLWPTWAPQITRVDCPDDRLRPGTRGTVVGPLWTSVAFVVDSIDDDARRWSWTVRHGPLRLRLTHGVAARGSGSETWLRVRGPLPVVVGYLPLARFALHRLVR